MVKQYCFKVMVMLTNFTVQRNVFKLTRTKVHPVIETV